MKLFIFILLFAFVPTRHTVSTIAGCSTCAYIANGPATASSLLEPNQITADNQGNIYISDYGNHVVRRMDKSGMMTVVAGNHEKGYSGNGGAVVAAAIANPSDVAFDSYGNMYIAESANQCVRKVNMMGIIFPYAGNRQSGYKGDGGPATGASMLWPIAIAIDKQNNLLIVDRGANCVRKVTPTGIITTLAGTGRDGYSGDGGPATAATLNEPTDIALDSKNNMYIADLRNNVIRKITPSGKISTFAGTGAQGCSPDGTVATKCAMKNPYGIFIDKKDNIYYSDNSNAIVRKIDTKNIVTTLAGTPGKWGYEGDGGNPLKCKMYDPGGIIIDDAGYLILADFGNNAVRNMGKVR